jgi:hypothetical protein
LRDNKATGEVRLPTHKLPRFQLLVHSDGNQFISRFRGLGWASVNRNPLFVRTSSFSSSTSFATKFLPGPH